MVKTLPTTCKNCGKPITQQGKGPRARETCSDACKAAFHRKHKSEQQEKKVTSPVPIFTVPNENRTQTMTHWIIEDTEVVDALRGNGFICEYPPEPWYATDCPIQLGGIYNLGNGYILVADGVKLRLEKS